MNIYYDNHDTYEPNCHNIRFVDNLDNEQFTLDIIIRNYKLSEFKELSNYLKYIIKNLLDKDKLLELKININNLIAKCICIYTLNNGARIVFSRDDCPNYAIDVHYYINNSKNYNNELLQKDFIISILNKIKKEGICFNTEENII